MSALRVVLLHYTPDNPVVDVLQRRLREAGIIVWDHRDDIEPGDDSQREVQDAIDGAPLVLLCVSDASSGCTWFESEWEWCRALLRDRRDALMLFQAGALDPSTLPGPTPDADNFFDLMRGDLEARCAHVVRLVQDRLGAAQRVPVTGVTVAMTRPEFDELWTDSAHKESRARLEALAAAAGIPCDEVRDVIGSRYGVTPQDLRPFSLNGTANQPADPPPEAERLSDVVGEIILDVNALRRSDRAQPPIAVHWLTEELARSDDGYHTARTQWETGDSLIIVDLASMLHPNCQAFFGRLPPNKHMVQRAVLCVSPFTRHTYEHELELHELARMTQPTENDLVDWICGRHLAEGRVLDFDFSGMAWLRCRLFAALVGAKGELMSRPDPTKRLRLGGDDRPPELFRGGGV